MLCSSSSSARIIVILLEDNGKMFREKQKCQVRRVKRNNEYESSE